MKILSADEMRLADRLTSERYAIPSIQLMEHAGEAVARFVLSELPRHRRITVLCGKGNNGGDGVVAARSLAAAGCEVNVVLLGDRSELRGDAKLMFEKLPFAPVSILNQAEFDAPRNRELFSRAELYLDAVVGTGFRPPLRGLAAAAGDVLNRYPRIPVVAVDLPSGWDADSREYATPGAYRADAVVTFTAPKLAHIFGMLTQGGDLVRPGNLKQGPIVVAPIGSPPDAIQSETGLIWAGGAKTIADSPRGAESNKGRFGHVLVVGGSYGKAGAPAMASFAALRTGAGLVTAAVCESILPTVANIAPELMTFPLAAGSKGEISKKNLDLAVLDSMLSRKTVIAVGPGLGQEPEAVEFFFGLLEQSKIPMVIDADALNALASDIGRLNGRGRLLVLTPHPGEMARLAGLTIAEVESNREALAKEFAIKHQVTLVLKGWRTIIAHPDGALAINTSGNPGLAKGGSGDILTGIVAAMIAQYSEQPAEAVNAAVYLHGLAADFAIRLQDQHTLLATDTLAHLSDAFRFRAEDKAGYVWLQGIPGSLREME
jgi:ADP-dependent NAD(P)H-hydrate dehydratase / NAD(P)H-hydrate epimerase